MSEAPIVTVEQGQLQGRLVPSPSGKSFYSFQGIPYAKPPLGSLRFKAPQPVEPWEGVREATAEGNVSAQIDPLIHKEYIGDENCLFLNVYTPNLDGAFLPVMIFIHGGGFHFGSGNTSLYGADYLVEKDVVVVTINYRCGPLGFLCLNTPDVPGNAGLKDMVQAVRWVKNNIEHFGGNSGNVTIFGESAGGVAVSLLTASPLTKDLVSKAIIQSGTALNSWGTQKKPLDNAKSLAKVLGCESLETDDILEFLSTTPVRDLVEATQKLNPVENFFEKGLCLFAPVVEKEFPGVEAALTEPFIDFLTSGRVAKIPIMIGSTAIEFSFEKQTDDFRVFIPEDLNIEKNSEEAVNIAEKIKKLYFKEGRFSIENLTEYFQLLSDKLINIDTHRYIKYLIKVTNKPIYYYKFNYVGELNLENKLLATLGLKQAAHMGELGYLFKNVLQKDVVPTSQDIKMRERMIRLWTNFAKEGNPTPDENHYITVNWLPVNQDNLYYLDMGTELALATNPDHEKMDFWEELYNKYFKLWERPQVNNIVSETLAPEEETVLVAESPAPEVIDNSEVVAEETVQVIETQTQQVVNTSVPEVVEIPKVETSEDQVEHPAEPINETVTIIEEVKPQNGDVKVQLNGNSDKEEIVVKARTSNEIKMVGQSNGVPKDVIRANDPPEDDLPKNIGVNKFVNFFESLGGKK